MRALVSSGRSDFDELGLDELGEHTAGSPVLSTVSIARRADLASTGGKAVPRAP